MSPPLQGGWPTRTGHTLVFVASVADQEAHNAGIALRTRGVENYLLGLASKPRLSSNSNAFTFLYFLG